ncbi:hypothetical protein EVAR_99059_1 [Eumeta japonica]|uniref:Nucleic-acid-binding protein from transposon X-element n=1 Tax=Eumeta variegata TaxID=151549 RepID=A0A4C1XZ02_EUMVA|nr:hypothetical protein EVAR_99059_1 [Eumeta japonica]
MVHSPYGELNRSYPCMKNEKCTKCYPKPFLNETVTGEDEYPKYRPEIRANKEIILALILSGIVATLIDGGNIVHSASSVRSPAPNGRYRVPAPSALTKLFAFCADRRPATLPALPIESPLRRRPPGSTTNNNLLFQVKSLATLRCQRGDLQRAGRWPFPFRERQTRMDLGPPALEGAPRRYQVSPAHPPSSLTPSSVSRLLDSPCSPGAGGSGPKTPITLDFIQPVLTKALSEIGYEAPQDVVKKLIARVTPVSSRASSRTTSPMETNKNKNKRQASSSSDEGATCSDSTVVGSDSESENTKMARDQPEMDIDPSSAPTSRANDAKLSPAAVQQTQTTSTAPVESTRNPVSASTQAVTAKTAPRTGAKPTAPPRPKLPPPIFLRKGANFLQISADCTRLRINYSKAVRTADDGIKIHCPDVETFRSLNKYLVDFKVQFHTCALEEERKLKAVIRSIPTDFPVDEIQADLCGQGFPVHSVHRLCRRDGSPL